ncbi:serine/threonine protein kinase [Agarivorans sp. 1_MG-2023]|uniref:serine/threonine protein kinase n=1 Tax=Agarivorans sp. 1_MG-2023 TaxID=3062634 RepID=UPI0026E1F32D|nr:serine/threonine protein kinase [Agarivorans sp. 1_MG-2023]MDO6764254.1 serine/threonine protein kinase [Agarivorans sp. 1_MG-2023]
MSAFLFAELHPDLILDAIESQGIFPSSGLLALNSYENRVYQFKAEDDLRYVVKFYRPERWSKAQIIEEHQFSLSMAEVDVPIVAPLVVNGRTLFEYQGWLFTIFPSVGGRGFEVDNLDQIERVGQYLGRMHQKVGTTLFEHRLSINTEEMLDQPLEFLRDWLPEGLTLPFFTIAEQVAEAAKAAYQPKSIIRLHGDCHPSNILWRDGPMLVDLDDARNGPAVQDLWMMLAGDDNERRLQLEVLLEGYEAFCEFDMSQLSLIEPLRAMRMIHYMGWLARRWQDAAFQRAFPWFNSQRYWEDQILALKEQLSALQQPPLSLTPAY